VDRPRVGGRGGRRRLGAAVRVALSAARVELVSGNSGQAREWLDRIGEPGESGSELAFLLAESYRSDEDWEEGVAALLRLQPELDGRAGWRRAPTRQSSAFAWAMSAHVHAAAAARLRGPAGRAERAQRAAACRAMGRGGGRGEAGGRPVAVGSRPRLHRAGALERLGRFDEAEPLFLELLEKDPGDVASANYLGYAWADRGTHLNEALS